MKRLYFIFLLIGFLGTNIYAQIPSAPKSIPSPNVANLGLYGEIPVSYFTGIPDVSIPLYEVVVGDLHVPFSMSYHAAGIRPDQHPGWTGLGWNLNSGGVISRIVNGRPDDLNIKNAPNYQNIGYYFHSEILAPSTWNTQDYLEESIMNFANIDIEPDEFNFSFLNYQGKFLMNSDRTWMVQCDKPVKVDFSGNMTKVPFNHDNTYFINSGYSPSFEGFTLTVEDGTQYIFGIDQNAIEYSIDFFNQATDTWTATAWHLTKIILATGQEITYSYVRGDFINQMNISLNDDIGSYSYNGGILSPECESSYHSTIHASYEGNLISPVYPARISFPECDVTFGRDETTELRYSLDIYDYKYLNSTHNAQYRFLHFLATDALYDNYPACLNKLKWYQLTNLEIKDKKGNWIKNFNFSYSSNQSQRLMLKSITEFVWNGGKGKSYAMKYNNPELLPAYLAGMVDHWGFYNKHIMSENYDIHYASREPNDQVLTYGILEKLYYPTGGYTRLEFEPHKYGKQVKMNRWEGYDDLPSSKTAGGLRIKKIINSVTGEEVDEKLNKEYFYVNDYLTMKDKANISSGVLGGQFKYYFDDYIVHSISDKNFKKVIKRFSSQSVLPACNNTSGCHIGYSEVIEKRIDGSFSRYQYTNFDNGHLDAAPEALIYPNRVPYQPYASREIERGRLLLKTDYTVEGVVKSDTKMTYERSTEQYAKSMSAIAKRICPNSESVYVDGCSYKVYLYNYRTKSEVNTTYDNLSAPVNLQTDYEYDQYGLVRETNTTVNGGILKHTYKRAYDYTSQTCKEMVKNHTLSPVIQEMEYFIPKGKPSQKLREINYDYTRMEGASLILFPCSSVWQRIGDGPAKYLYQCLDFDKNTHPLYVIKGNEHTVYLWGYNFTHLTAEIKGVTLREVETAMGDLYSFMKAETPDLAKLTLLRTTLPQAQITSYTYQPMAGITSIIDPRGVSTYYEYDFFQRLKSRKDNNGKIEQKYDYHYSLDLQ